MNLVQKISITFFTALSLASAALLWLTRVVDLKSQSMYCDQPNLLWYVLMHVGITMTFFILNASFKRKLYGLVSFTSIATLMFDVFAFTALHNISTAILFLTACAAIIIYGGYKLRDIIFCSLGAAYFVFGLFGMLGPSGIFFGEFVAEFCISLALLHQVWKIS